MKNKLVTLLTLILIVSSVNGQIVWKNWNTAVVNLSLSRKLDLRLSHLRAFELSNGFQSDFNQSSIQLGYDITRKFEISAGYVVGGSNTLTDGTSRFTTRFGYKVKLFKILNWTNALQGELHSASEVRYKNRIVLSSRLALRKRLAVLKLLPSVSYSLFYNIGGSPIQYYDKVTGLPSVSNTPDGFHRGRFVFNLNSKISDRVSCSVYYMAQREFNIFSSEDRKINITKPSNGKIVRPFDDYNVLGLTVSYEFKLYKKSNKN